MATQNKEDFKNLLSKMSVQKEKDVPIQKVVPTIDNSNSKKNNDDSEIKKISLSIYVEDWLDIVRFKNFKVLEQKNLEYTISDAIQYGLNLLEKKNSIERNRNKFSLKRGRRNKDRIDVKTTSIDLPTEKVNFINDFLYHKVFDLENIDYTRPEMFSEMIELIKLNNEIVFEK